ncbi:MAG: hypothetical protein SPK18_08495, partial [Treponema sp.]|nr:hypothetical protein [Treponema sp.]MDY5758603.1 hypothetical protein [Treponema sp.]
QPDVSVSIKKLHGLFFLKMRYVTLNITLERIIVKFKTNEIIKQKNMKLRVPATAKNDKVSSAFRYPWLASLARPLAVPPYHFLPASHNFIFFCSVPNHHFLRNLTDNIINISSLIRWVGRFDLNHLYMV